MSLPINLARVAETIARLTEQVAAVCPIEGVSVGDWADKRTWRIDFAATASADEQAAARAVMADFDAGNPAA